MTKVQSHTIHYGYIVDSDENVIDEVMVAVMKAPRSYTTEDTVEINCHGGVLVMQKYWKRYCMPVPDWRSRVNLQKGLF